LKTKDLFYSTPLGKKWFAFSNINLNALEMLKKLEHDSNNFAR